MFFARLTLPAILACTSVFAQSAAPAITKVDPPNWWANMPKAMLLVKGDHLEGAHFRCERPALRIEKTSTSANGHWAELWLADAPVRPEEVTISAETAAGHVSFPFRFLSRRAATDGFAGFSSRDVMYLIMTDRFADGDRTNDGPEGRSPADSPAAVAERLKPRGWHGGDLRGVADHLDYLQALGITTVWITPVDQNHEPGSYHGYGATDMYAVDEHYGRLEDYRALAAALHARGMKLVLDTVPNHIGPAHPWVQDEPEPDWFHGTKAVHRQAQGNFLPLTDPHAPWRDQRDVTQGWFADVLPDMNQENPAVAQYLIQNAVWWTEQAGLDGLRIDTFPYIARPFWGRFHATLHALYPHLTTVGEVFNGDPTVTSSFAGGVTRTGADTGLYTPFDYPLHFGLRNVFTGMAPMTQLADLLRQDSLYPHPERLVPFLDNHDTVRFLNEPGANTTMQRLALAFLLTNRGMPQLYSGDEIAMTGGEDPDNRHDFPGGFPGHFPIEAAKIKEKPVGDAFDASTRTPGQEEMYAWTRELLKLRHAEPALQTGDEQVVYASADALAFVRSEGSRRLLVALHLGKEDVCLPIPQADTALAGVQSAAPLFGAGTLRVKDDAVTVCLVGNGVLIAALR